MLTDCCIEATRHSAQASLTNCHGCNGVQAISHFCGLLYKGAISAPRCEPSSCLTMLNDMGLFALHKPTDGPRHIPWWQDAFQLRT